VGPDGRLYAFQPTLKRIVVYSSDGHEEVVAENVEASDMAITAQSTLYFADAVHSTVGYIDAKRRTRIVYEGGEIALPSGVALSPDQALLIVTDGQGRLAGRSKSWRTVRSSMVNHTIVWKCQKRDG
jgi:streptogramin lyase